MPTREQLDTVDWQGILANASHPITEYYHSEYTKNANHATEETNAQVYSFWARITSMYLDTRSNPESPLQPMIVLVDGRRSPIPDDFSDSDLDLLSSIADEITDAELQARVFDLLWIRRRDYQVARRAVDAYFETAKRLLSIPNGISWACHRFTRATQLARSINDRAKLKSMVSEVEELVLNASSDEDFLSFRPVLLARLLLEHKKAVSDAVLLQKAAEQGALSAMRAKNWHLAHEYWELKAAWHSPNEAEYIQAKIQAAEAYVKEAEDAANDTPPRHIAALASIEVAIEALRRIGGREERIAQLHVLLNQYGEQSLNEMGEISIPINLTQVADESSSRVRGKTLNEALYTLIALGRSEKVKDIRVYVENMLEEHPIQYLISSRSLNDMGKVTARRTSSLDDREEVIKYEMLQHLGRAQDIFAMGVIVPALQQIRLEHHVRVTDIDFLITDNPLIPLGREEIYARGLHAGLVGDYGIALHLLLPQIENSLRHILQRLGVITSRLNNDLIQDEYTLDKILFRTELEQAFDADLLYELRSLLAQRAGSNLRNLMAHGLLESDDLSSARVIYMWWFILRLCGLPKIIAARALGSSPKE